MQARFFLHTAVNIYQKIHTEAGQVRYAMKIRLLYRICVAFACASQNSVVIPTRIPADITATKSHIQEKKERKYCICPYKLCAGAVSCAVRHTELLFHTPVRYFMPAVGGKRPASDKIYKQILGYMKCKDIDLQELKMY